jgi:anaerobic selenocysteine-containing dehydrogenase
MPGIIRYSGPEIKRLLKISPGVGSGRCDPEKNLEVLATEDKRIHIHIPEMADWVQSIEPRSEEAQLQGDADRPFILMAGRHTDMNANTLMRDPAWNKGKRPCTLAMNPGDAEVLGLTDGQTVRVTTEAGSVEVELELDAASRPGTVIMPHGFGLEIPGGVYGANVNRLTKNTHRDPLAGTPLHRYVRCRVEAAF